MTTTTKIAKLTDGNWYTIPGDYDASLVTEHDIAQDGNIQPVTLHELADRVTGRKDYDDMMAEVYAGWTPTLKRDGGWEEALGEAIESSNGRVFWA